MPGDGSGRTSVRTLFPSPTAELSGGLLGRLRIFQGQPLSSSRAKRSGQPQHMLLRPTGSLCLWHTAAVSACHRALEPGRLPGHPAVGRTRSYTAVVRLTSPGVVKLLSAGRRPHAALQLLRTGAENRNCFSGISLTRQLSISMLVVAEIPSAPPDSACWSREKGRKVVNRG